MFTFQESMLEHGLEEFLSHLDESALDMVMVLIHYVLVMTVECLEGITNLDDKVIHHGLMHQQDKIDQEGRNDLGDKVHKELCAWVKWLEAEYIVDQWKLKKVHEQMVTLEAQLAKLETPEVVDLTQEEDEGGVGGLIILAEETPALELVNPPLEHWELDSNDERALAGLLVGITADQSGCQRTVTF